jgi:Holliday junction DNA helicase RuvB
MRARFGIDLRLNYYPATDLEQVVRRTAQVLKVPIEDDAASEIARRARGTPRLANRLLRRIRDFAQVKGDGTITRELARRFLSILDVDEVGLDDMDARILRLIIEKHDGGPVGVANVAAAIGEDPATIEEVYEPFLVQNGYLQRTPRGRVATSQAYKHLGYTPPSRGDQATLF